MAIKVNSREIEASKQRRRGAVLSYIHLTLSTVISLLYVPILLNAMGKSEYGVYQLIASVVSYLTIMGSTLSATTIRYYSTYKVQNNKEMVSKVLTTARLVFFVMSIFIVLLGGIIYFILTPFYANSLTSLELNHAKQAFIILILQLFIEVNGCVYTSIIISNERFVFLKLLSIGSILLSPIVLILIINDYPYAMTVASVHLLSSLVLIFIKFVYSRYGLKIKIENNSIDPKLLKEMTIFSLGLLLSVVADQLFWKTDQVILSKMKGSSITAIYSIGATVYATFISFASSINGLFLPKIAALVANQDDDAINTFFIKIGRYQFLLLSLVLSGFILFGREFITLWVGKEYLDVYIIVILIIAPLTPDMCEAVGLLILQARNQYNFRACLYLLTALLNCVLTIFLVKTYSGIGAAIATGISVVVGSLIVLNIYYIKVQKLPIFKLYQEMLKIIPIYSVLVPIGMLINKIGNGTENWILLIVKIVVYCICYILVVGFVLTKDEKNLVREFISNKLKRQTINE